MAEYLYAETLIKMVNPKKQKLKTQEYLLFLALFHVVEATNKGFIANWYPLIIDSAKLGWNICNRLKYSAANRSILLKPMYTVFFYLR